MCSVESGGQGAGSSCTCSALGGAPAPADAASTENPPPQLPVERIANPNSAQVHPELQWNGISDQPRRHSDVPVSPLPFRRTSLPDPRARTRTQEMLVDHMSIQHLFENNRIWRETKKSAEPAFFERTAEKQNPRYLWIGCSDSRVPAEEVTGLAPGEMFVHRNVANLVVSNDISSLAVIQFAVEKLRVKDIIVCGHYGCGGVLAAMENKTLGLLDNWLRNIRDVCRLYQPDLVEIKSEIDRFRRIVELNIIEQCLNIFKINMVQRHQIKYGFPRIHGLVYDIRTGELKELDIDFHGYLRKFSGIYRLHSYPTDDIPKSRSQMRVNIVRYLVEGHEEDEGRVSVRYITRALKAEKELFEAQEVDDAIAYAKELLTDELSPFIAVEDVIRYFDEDSIDGDIASMGGAGVDGTERATSAKN